MRLFIVLFVIGLSTIGLAQTENTTRKDTGSTHLMGSGTKNVEGMGVNKDSTKYKNLENKSKKELENEKVGNNPTGTDSIKGQNSKKVKD